MLLLIEVSDTTLAYDRGVKLPLYAKAGITEVWIVDLAGKLSVVTPAPQGKATGAQTGCVADRRWSPSRYPA